MYESEWKVYFLKKEIYYLNSLDRSVICFQNYKLYILFSFNLQHVFCSGFKKQFILPPSDHFLPSLLLSNLNHKINLLYDMTDTN